ncbi:hypothetical protein GCK32_009948 [Trichostrongylus colubriformis]|uniref:Bestrophin homolog n=1 Tax=Trichostrongylus colubriformis TaxID=6319 RepID=A0AAN8FQR7_TRICO
MTVNYNLSVSTSHPWTFIRLFFSSFTCLVDFTNSRLSWIPLDLMLGFFVAGVLKRFWYLYNIIGFMDNIALMTALYVRGTHERARQCRRNIIRYCQLTQVLVFRDLSMKCRKRFPTLDTVAAAGLIHYLISCWTRDLTVRSQQKHEQSFTAEIQVAEALLNPWGEDDDDFETNVLIDRNLAMGLKIVDDGYGRTPELRKDAFWDDEWVPLYSEESAWEKKYTQHEGSLSHIKLDKSVSQIRMVPLQRNDSVLRRRFSSAIEKIVPVKNSDTTSRSSMGFIRSPSKLSFHLDGKSMSRKNSLANFLDNFRNSAKETPMRMSSCDRSDAAAAVTTTAASDSCPRMTIDSSASGLTLNNGDGDIMNISPPSSGGPLSRVMTDENNGAMGMFSIGERDIRIALESLEPSTDMAEIELADPKDVEEALAQRPPQNQDPLTPANTPATTTDRKPSLQFSYST